MTDYSSENERPVTPDVEPDAAPAGPTRVDRRSFLRALSGSALTLVAGGLTVTLAGCNSAPGGNAIVSDSSFSFGGLPGTSNSFSSSSSSFPATGSGTGSAGSSSSGSGSSSSGSSSSGSSTSGSSGSSGSSNSGSSSSGSSSSTGGPPGAVRHRGNTRH